jgi:phospho-N-acetylmuramoyl-pentapeptide-transferase
MLYLLYEWFHSPDGPLRFLRLLRSQLVRSAGAAAVGFLIVYFAMPAFIRFLRRRGVSEQSRHYSQLNRRLKSAVPTMGGAVFLSAIVASALLWCDPTSRFIQIVLLVGVGAAAIGALDDLAKIRGGHNDSGLSRNAKYAAQILLGAGLAVALLSPLTSPIQAETVRESVYVPFVKPGLQIPLFTFVAVVLFFVFASNSVNLTDGMDGLATVPSMLVFIVLGAFAYLLAREDYAPFLQYFPYPDESGKTVMHNLPGAGELIVLCAAGVGSLAGFLWYNAFPATVMMGDTGAMGLGSLLGSIAVLLRQEAIFLLAGGVFVIEIASSFVQDYIGLKLLGRRILFRAPYHSSLLHQGVSENKVTVRLWILAAAFAGVALATLKLR